jgi:cell division protein FtsL
VIAFALIGIVAAQLWVVKLNVGIGRAIEHAATLQRENSALAIEDSTLSSGERIEQLASAQGMVPAPPGALHFDTVRGPLDVRLAAAALARPTQPQAANSATAGTETSASATTADEPASPEATSAPGASTETPSAAGESTSSPAATATTPSTTAASTPEPSATGGASEAASKSAATGGASEAPASAPGGAVGGTQAAPGG